ncbi:MAG: hypothetical protein PWR12_1611 [Eubacteriaceae bacterium]|nr:hypothetical protein [Eubacteriaceae bacterium]
MHNDQLSAFFVSECDPKIQSIKFILTIVMTGRGVIG